MSKRIVQLLDEIGNLSAKAWTELYEGWEYGTPTQFHNIAAGRLTLLRIKPLVSELNNLLSSYE